MELCQIYQGDYNTLIFEYYEDTQETIPFDLSSYDNIFVALRSDNNVVQKYSMIEKENYNHEDFITDDLANGKFSIQIRPSVSKLLKQGIAIVDIKFIKNELEHTIISGNVFNVLSSSLKNSE